MVMNALRRLLAALRPQRRYPAQYPIVRGITCSCGTAFPSMEVWSMHVATSCPTMDGVQGPDIRPVQTAELLRTAQEVAER